MVVPSYEQGIGSLLTHRKQPNRVEAPNRYCCSGPWPGGLYDSEPSIRPGSTPHDQLQRDYGLSKLANLILARELDRRSAAEGWGIRSTAAHQAEPSPTTR